MLYLDLTGDDDLEATQPYQASDDEASEPSSSSSSSAESKHDDRPAKKPRKDGSSAQLGQVTRVRENKRVGKSKEWFLTYPQCNTDPQLVIHRAKEYWSDLLYVLVGQELHQDGNLHLHVFLQFSKQRQFHGVGILDELGGRHGNYQIARNRNHVVEYCKKAGLWFEEGEFSSGDVYADALSKPSFDLSLAHLRTHKPRDYVLYNQQITSTLRKEKPAPPLTYSAPNNSRPWCTPPLLEEWLRSEAVLSSRARCLILVGPSRLGKTSWALAHSKTPMWFRGHFSLKEWNPSAGMIIFDDCSDICEKKSMTMRKCLLTQNGYCVMTDKYCQKERINVNMPAILLCNERPEFLDDEKESKYWDLNSVYCEIEDKLYE